MNLFYFFFGYWKIYANESSCLALLNLCMERGLSYGGFHADEEGGVCFVCDPLTGRRLQALCVQRGICIAVVKRGGVPYFLWRYRRRVGMAIGLCIGIALLWLSGRFVWDVRITGNEGMSEQEVREALRENGFGVGSYIPSLDCASLENRVMMASDSISWISVYLDGTVAMVQIRERLNPQMETETKPANLVATHDGQIELVQVYRGNSLVKVGQAVRRGELLVSGVYDSQSVGAYYTRAAGEVFARVEETLRIEIPLSYERKVTARPEIASISLEFFEKTLKIFQNSRNSTTQCDIIENRKVWNLLGICALPFAWHVERALPYRMEWATRTEEEALALAYDDLECALARLSEDAQLLRKSISATITDAAVILECTVVTVRNIAEQVELEVVP